MDLALTVEESGIWFLLLKSLDQLIGEHSAKFMDFLDVVLVEKFEDVGKGLWCSLLELLRFPTSREAQPDQEEFGGCQYVPEGQRDGLQNICRPPFDEMHLLPWGTFLFAAFALAVCVAVVTAWLLLLLFLISVGAAATAAASAAATTAAPLLGLAIAICGCCARSFAVSTSVLLRHLGIARPRQKNEPRIRGIEGMLLMMMPELRKSQGLLMLSFAGVAKVAGVAFT
mmetsp:Transcript_1232/g.2724  ORF Transcript_1232/g.2724 Transcript_1232/m.2724 type:complete len:228 (+) Transcript_1232:352-1035(+)